MSQVFKNKIRKVMIIIKRKKEIIITIIIIIIIIIIKSNLTVVVSFYAMWLHDYRIVRELSVQMLCYC